jgi:hypothetical protein
MFMIPVMAVKAQYFGEVDGLFTRFLGFIDNVLIPLIFALTLLIFVWGMFRFFVWGQANEEDRSKGRQMILWSIIGMMFMVSIWGIVAIFSEGIFGTSTGSNAPKLPGTPTL